MNAVSVALQNIDSNVPVFRMTTLEAQLEASFAQTRQAAWLSGLFAVLALFLSAVGVYGVMALAIGRRTHEIGIRMALGAAPRKIVRTIGARAVIVVLAGLVLGLAVSLAFTHVADSLLFGVTAADTGTFAGMATLLGAVALVALSLPIRSAIRLDVVATIRRE
jgi:putative ABC transport system permease protein